MWQPEDNLQESFLYFYHVGSGDQTQVIGLGGRHLDLLSPLLSLDCLDRYHYLGRLMRTTLGEFGQGIHVW